MLCSRSQRENHLEFIGFASVSSFGEKVAFILQIKDDVYSSSARWQMSAAAPDAAMESG